MKYLVNSVSDNKPKFEKEERSPTEFVEYGYGFWARFLTAYPERLLNGKNAAWYFMARLSKNERNGNTEMGDRMLAIW